MPDLLQQWAGWRAGMTIESVTELGAEGTFRVPRARVVPLPGPPASCTGVPLGVAQARAGVSEFASDAVLTAGGYVRFRQGRRRGGRPDARPESLPCRRARGRPAGPDRGAGVPRGPVPGRGAPGRWRTGSACCPRPTRAEGTSPVRPYAVGRRVEPCLPLCRYRVLPAHGAFDGTGSERGHLSGSPRPPYRKLPSRCARPTLGDARLRLPEPAGRRSKDEEPPASPCAAGTQQSPHPRRRHRAPASAVGQSDSQSAGFHHTSAQSRQSAIAASGRAARWKKGQGVP